MSCYFMQKLFQDGQGRLQQHLLEHIDKVYLVLLMFQTNKVPSTGKLSVLRIILYGSFSMATWWPIKILEWGFIFTSPFLWKCCSWCIDTLQERKRGKCLPKLKVTSPFEALRLWPHEREKWTHANVSGWWVHLQKYTCSTTFLWMLWHKAVKPKAKSLVSQRNTNLQRWNSTLFEDKRRWYA